MSSIHPTTRRPWIALTLVALAAFLAPPLAALDAARPETPEQKLLHTVSTATPEAMRAAYDLDSEIVQKIMAHRKSGKIFSTAEEFKEVTGLTVAQVLTVAKAAAEQKSMMTPPEQPRERMKAMPAREGSVQEENTPLVSNVRPGFYGKLPGFDKLETIEPLLKEEFLQRMNHEKCPCGCENETLAYCLVNDPGCPVVKARAQKIYEEVTSKAPAASEKAEE